MAEAVADRGDQPPDPGNPILVVVAVADRENQIVIAGDPQDFDSWVVGRLVIHNPHRSGLHLITYIHIVRTSLNQVSLLTIARNCLYAHKANIQTSIALFVALS